MAIQIDTRRTLPGARSGPGKVDVQGLVREAIRDAVLRVQGLEVPGDHTGGISNQDLFDILEAKGRPFLLVNTALREWLRARLTREYEGARYVPGLPVLMDRIEELARLRVQNRMIGAARDVRVKALSAKYSIAKHKAGYDGPPGVRTGELLASVKGLRVVT